jgi:hypothetical protein
MTSLDLERKVGHIKRDLFVQMLNKVRAIDDLGMPTVSGDAGWSA